jgi:hypothetical protein
LKPVTDLVSNLDHGLAGEAFAAGTQAAEALKTTLVALQSNPNAELPKV